MVKKSKKVKPAKIVKKKKRRDQSSTMEGNERLSKNYNCVMNNNKHSGGLFVDTSEGSIHGIQAMSLQDAFSKFRKSKQEEILALRNERKRRNTNPKRMEELRKKFLDCCKKYIGVPYKKKYHKPGSVDYNSNLFLDCCGLIRRVLRDLSKDFGFRVGPWNQAYMFDTLPVVVSSEEEMKPGDLVFISGVYFNQKMRSQPHKMVHVEVWLGDGIKTIGARWHRGRVQIFDSYRFESTSYHSMTYHFKSIDTWLQGVCRSFCHRHSWRHPGHFQPSRRSVFFDGQSTVTPVPQSTGDVELEENDDQEGAASEDELLPTTSIAIVEESDVNPSCIGDDDDDERSIGNNLTVKSNLNIQKIATNRSQQTLKFAASCSAEARNANTNTSPTTKFISFSKTIDVATKLLPKQDHTNPEPSIKQTEVISGISNKSRRTESSSKTLESFANLRKPLHFFTTKGANTHNPIVNHEKTLRKDKSIAPPTEQSIIEMLQLRHNALADRTAKEAVERALAELKIFKLDG